MPQHEAGTIVAQLIQMGIPLSKKECCCPGCGATQMGIPLSKKECCCPGCGATRGMRGMLFGIASGTNGVIVLMTGMSFRAFVGVSGSISAIMSPTVDTFQGCLGHQT